MASNSLFAATKYHMCSQQQKWQAYNGGTNGDDIPIGCSATDLIKGNGGNNRTNDTMEMIL